MRFSHDIMNYQNLVSVLSASAYYLYLVIQNLFKNLFCLIAQ